MTMATLTRGTSEESTRHLVVPARLRVLTQTAHAIGTVAKQAKGNEMIPALASPSQNEEKAESILSMGSIANKRLRNPTGIQMTDAMMGTRGPASVESTSECVIPAEYPQPGQIAKAVLRT